MVDLYAVRSPILCRPAVLGSTSPGFGAPCADPILRPTQEPGKKVAAGRGACSVTS
jgi:hypothetical protein